MPAESPTWHHPRILLVLLAVFLFGMAAGGFAARILAQKPQAPSWTEAGKRITIETLVKELDLSPEQAVQIETVLDEFVLYYQNLQGQMEDFRADGRERIVRVLSPEQRAKFEKLLSSHTPARLR
jgi:Spy/CpxP family protein refolding chaperone